jgi:hypothetical protein
MEINLIQMATTFVGAVLGNLIGSFIWFKSGERDDYR